MAEVADQSHPEATRQLVARTRRLRDLLAGFGRRYRGLSLVEPPAGGVGVRVKNISAFTPDRSPHLGLVRVLERAIKEAKEELRPADWERVRGFRLFRVFRGECWGQCLFCLPSSRLPCSNGVTGCNSVVSVVSCAQVRLVVHRSLRRIADMARILRHPRMLAEVGEHLAEHFWDFEIRPECIPARFVPNF